MANQPLLKCSAGDFLTVGDVHLALCYSSELRDRHYVYSSVGALAELGSACEHLDFWARFVVLVVEEGTVFVVLVWELEAASFRQEARTELWVDTGIVEKEESLEGEG